MQTMRLEQALVQFRGRFVKRRSRPASPPYFEPVFRTGIETIDDQHGWLLGLLQSFQGADPLRETARRFLAEFVALAGQHLRDEERVLERLNYPHLEEHRQEHEWLLVELERIREEFNNGEGPEFPELMEYLWEWTIEHLIESDSGYLPYLPKG